MFNYIKQKYGKYKDNVHIEKDKIKYQIGELNTRLLRNSNTTISELRDCEFSVFSQYGQDGIIQYLIHQIPNIRESFVEFGVQSYAESNTRFLLKKWNWSGLIIDGDDKHLQYVKKAGISWQHDLEVVQAFLTRENINDIIGKRFEGEIGILSVDIDGMDYWLLDAIDVVSPQIVIVEYNPSYLDEPLTLPYKVNHKWDDVGNSFIYFGASLAAFKYWAERRGYTFVGCDSSGTDAFFVRNDVAKYINVKGDFVYRKSYWNFEEQILKYGELPLINVVTNNIISVKEYYSNKKLRYL